MSFTVSHHAKFERASSDPEYLRVNPDEVAFLRDVPLYVKSGENFMLYQDPHAASGAAGVLDEDLRDRLYIRAEHREDLIVEVQRGMVEHALRETIARGDLGEVKMAFASLMEEALAAPRIKVLQGFTGMVQVMAEEYARDDSLLKGFLLVAEQGYGVAEHSFSVMALVMGYARRAGMDMNKTRNLALGGLLHDIGKTGLPEHLRQPNRPLNEKEFALYRTHPQLGLDLIQEGDFPRTVQQAVLEHHERLDGSGYPLGLGQLSEVGQVLGLADSYEYLTNQERLQGRRLEPLATLRLLKAEVEQGKYAQEVFEKFAYSLI
jgi:putative nucleotidyltransferase with HDIG domain